MGLLCNFVNVLFFPLGLASLILIIIIIIKGKVDMEKKYFEATIEFLTFLSFI